MKDPTGATVGGDGLLKDDSRGRAWVPFVPKGQGKILTEKARGCSNTHHSPSKVDPMESVQQSPHDLPPAVATVRDEGP